ncbi:MAG: hypothetical protein HY084_05565 [Gemmatimonadetes bacterium]|nr:hypothetical protein [Gemmatimonadota bacterium]
MFARGKTRVGAALCLLLGLGARASSAQSASQLGAWDALMLSPAGALTPVAHDPGEVAAGARELSLRYGRWRYDADDAVHDNIGVTWTYHFGRARTQLAITAAYGLVECPTCSGWTMGGVDLQSTAYSRDFATSSPRPITAGVEVRGSLGFARYRGEGTPTAVSASLVMPLEVSLPVPLESRVTLALIPGFGYGEITSADAAEGTVLPMLGGAVAWSVTSRLSINLGLQRVVLQGGPMQIGTAVSWAFGTHGGLRK